MCDKHEKEETHQMRLLPFVVAEHYELVYLLAERSPQERDDLSAGHFLQRQRKVTICARVQSLPGAKDVSLTPVVTLFM